MIIFVITEFPVLQLAILQNGTKTHNVAPKSRPIENIIWVYTKSGDLNGSLPRYYSIHM